MIPQYIIYPLILIILIVIIRDTLKFAMKSTHKALPIYFCEIEIVLLVYLIIMGKTLIEKTLYYQCPLILTIILFSELAIYLHNKKYKL